MPSLSETEKRIISILFASGRVERGEFFKLCNFDGIHDLERAYAVASLRKKDLLPDHIPREEVKVKSI